MLSQGSQAGVDSNCISSTSIMLRGQANKEAPGRAEQTCVALNSKDLQAPDTISATGSKGMRNKWPHHDVAE